MTTDADLIAALRKCEHCGGKGYTETENHTPAAWACPHCHLARMAADRIEAKNRQLAALDGELKAASVCEIAERVRERCARECEETYGGKCDGADAIRALTVRGVAEVILQQGLHPNVPMDVYLSDPAPQISLSSGAIWTLNYRCPRAAWREHPRLGGCAREPTKATNLGTYAHAMLLGEGEDDVVVIDRRDYPSKTGSIPDGWTNNAIRTARDDAIAAGKTPILADDIGRVQQMVAAARAYIAASERPELLTSGDAETVGIWKDGPIWCRMRMDWASQDRSIILDYKTTAASADPESWIRSQLVPMGYDIQAEFYARGMKRICGTDPQFLFLVQEIEPPYLCSLVGMAPGMREMAARKVASGMAKWDACLRSGVWPGYSPRIAWAEPQNWQVTQWEDRRAVMDLELAEQA